MIGFNKIVSKLWKKPWGIVLLSDIEELVDPENSRKAAGKREVYKTVYRLKAEGVIFPLRNGIFFILPKESDRKNLPSEAEIIQTSYWKIVQACVRKEVRADAIVAGPKGLELRLRDFSVPSTLIVYTKDVQKKIALAEGIVIHFRTVEGGKRAKKNLFPEMKRSYSESMEIEPGIALRILVPEAALLDALLIHRGSPEIDGYLVKKFLARFGSSLSEETLGRLVELRYISSINRLREIAKNSGNEALYRKTVDVIRESGAGCFLTFAGTKK